MANDDLGRAAQRGANRRMRRDAAQALQKAKQLGADDMEQARQQAEQVGQAMAELAKRNLLQFLKIDRLATAWAAQCARIVELKRMGRWLLAEQERDHRAKLGRLQQLHNTLRAEHGLPPVVLVGVIRGDSYIEEWCTVEHRSSVEHPSRGETHLLLPDGMWERRSLNCVCPTLNMLGALLPKQFTCPVHDTKCHDCPWPVEYNDGTDEWYHVASGQHVCPEPYKGFAYPASAPPSATAD